MTIVGVTHIFGIPEKPRTRKTNKNLAKLKWAKRKKENLMKFNGK